MTIQTENEIPEAMAEYKQPVTVAEIPTVAATYSTTRDFLILLLGDPDYNADATVAYDSTRGYFKMPDGSKRRVLGNLATMSRREFSKWCYENNVGISDKQRIYRALRFYRDPDYGRKERKAQREYQQRIRH